MAIQMIGIDHSRAGVEIREQFSFTQKQNAELMRKWKSHRELSGMVLLSTCNRMEVYINADEDDTDYYQLLCEEKKVDAGQYRSFFCQRQGMDAVRHLFGMTAGMHSMIVGEDQILSQVKEALSFAREEYATDQVLEVLFRQAVTTAKEVKTKAPLSRANLSAVSEAVATLKRHGAVLKGKKCLVIGNGVMGKLTAETLLEEGADVTVTVRQYHRGIVDIPAGASRISYGERYEWLSDCDFVFSVTASPNLTLTKEKLEQCRRKMPQVFVDLAVPRDIEPFVRSLPGITLYDVDDFSAAGFSQEDGQYDKAKKLVEAGIEEFQSWYECRDLIPTVQKIADAAADDLCWRLKKPLRYVATAEEGWQEKLLEAIGNSGHKVAARMIFALRDGLNTDTFRECLEILQQEWKVE